MDEVKIPLAKFTAMTDEEIEEAIEKLGEGDVIMRFSTEEVTMRIVR